MDKQFYVDLLDSIDDGVYFVDADRRITYWNGGAERLTGYNADEVVGHPCADGILRHVNGAGSLLCLRGCPLQATIQDGKSREAALYMHHSEGHRVAVRVRAKPLFDSDGRIVGAVETFSERSDDVALGQFGRRGSDPNTDTVTGLPVRRYGELFLDSGLQAVAEGSTTLGVLFIDADHFKSINDRFGHRMGDDVLRMLGRSLSTGLRRGDMPVRWGGEEFLAIQMGIGLRGLEATAERIRMLIEHSWIQRGETQASVTVSIGATMALLGEGREEVVERADRLMYASKRDGRNCVTSDDGSVERRGDLPVPWHGFEGLERDEAESVA